MNCSCAVADSFNVRASDSQCPIHGIDSDMATHEEIKNVLREKVTPLKISPGLYEYVIKNSDLDSIVRNLLARYEIRRKTALMK